MKKTNRKTIVLTALLLCLSLMFNSCKKGDTGPKGDTGAQGSTGPKGDDGKAYVIGTNIVTINSWSSSGSSWTATLTAAGITQDVVNKGIVTVFIQYGTEWWSLPDINGVNSTQYGFGLGYVSLFNSNSNGTAATNPGSKTFRVVIVSASNREANPTVNWKNYSEVKRILNLQN